jgi:hypothetical protein
MRRWMFMAVLSVALLSMPLWAQRGGHGGMVMGGAHGGFVSYGGGMSGSRTVPAPGYSGSAGRYYYHYGYRPYYPRYYRHFRFGYPYYGYSYFGYYGGGLSDWSDSSNSYPEQSYPAYVNPAPDGSSALLATQQQEINRLNDEVANLRAASASPPPQAEEVHKTVLVFRDRHVEQIEDYAIVGDTLWVFTNLRTRKVLLAQLDIPATTKVNADRGVDFQLPGQ